MQTKYQSAYPEHLHTMDCECSKCHNLAHVEPNIRFDWSAVLFVTAVYVVASFFF